MIPYRNRFDRYGLIHIMIHWAMALALVGMFCLGLWMVTLDYYDSWYKKGPDLHRSIGVIIVIVLLLRLVYRLTSVTPAPLPTHSPLEQLAARAVHGALYALVALVAFTGYLISTADGRSVLVFNWFEVPATILSIPDQEDVAGDVHLFLAITLMGLAGLHGLAALKHHVVDKDATMRRMFGQSQRKLL